MLRSVCLCRVALVLNNNLLFGIYPSPFSIPVGNLQEYTIHAGGGGLMAETKQIKAKIFE